jgi:hypothetical protein
MFSPCFFNESRVALENQFCQRFAQVSNQRHPARRATPRQESSNGATLTGHRR